MIDAKQNLSDVYVEASNDDQFIAVPNERPLATIERVKELKAIAGADNIEIAIIKGWQAIVKKGEFKQGDLCVFFEVDAFLPVEPQYEFLRRGSTFKILPDIGEGFRIRTMRLRGVLSQGLAMPLSSVGFSSIRDFLDTLDMEGSDVTTLLGVRKYEKPLPAALRGAVLRYFPSFVPKTDQERIQNIFDTHRDKLIGKEFEVTLKLDGSSMTVYKDLDGNVGVCSRNLELKTDESNEGNAFVATAKRLGLFDKIPNGSAVQGELMGPGIQDNREGLMELDFFVYDVWDIESKAYLDPLMRAHFMFDFLQDVKYAPLLEVLTITELTTLQDLLDYADKQNSLNHAVAEGVVFKCMTEDFSFKVISNKYLLKEE